MNLPFGIVITRKTAEVPDPPIDRTYLSGSRVGRHNALSGAPDREVGMPNVSGLGGRKSKDNTVDMAGIGFWQNFARPRIKGESVGLSPTLDLADFSRMDIDSLTDLLSEISPEFSKALWDYLLLSNSGYSIKCYQKGQNYLAGQTNDEDPKANEALQLITDKIAEHNGTLGVWFDRLFKMMFLRGSFMLELVLAGNGRDFVDIATPDTRSLEFRRRVDSERGQYWVFGQRINGEFKDLSIYPTIKYIPVHPSPDSIEGTPMGSSVLFLAIFLMAVLRDTKRVVQHQGYLRLDVEVMFEKLKDTIPQETASDPEKLTTWMNQAISEVQQVYSTLEPDDTYVHSDSIKINNPVGSVSADALEAIDSLFNVLERMAVRALKSMPILLATTASRTETQANREWEIYSKGIETVQHFVEAACEYIFQLALSAQGIQTDVKVRFETFRAAEKMRDAQVDYIVAKNARFLYDCGIIDMKEMANLTGYPDADAEEPRGQINQFTEPSLLASPENPNPGEGRAPITNANLKRIFELSRMPSSGYAQEATDFLKEYAPELLTDLYDANLSGAPDTNN